MTIDEHNKARERLTQRWQRETSYARLALNRPVRTVDGGSKSRRDAAK